MKGKPWYAGMLAVWLLALFVSARVYAETATESRSIYVGDLVTLTIAAEGLSEAALHEKFHSFEIVELLKHSEGYTLSLRTFEPGEYTISMGNQRLIISVASTLTDIPRETVFEGESPVAAPGFYFPWRMLFWASLGVGLLSAGVRLLRRFARPQSKPQSPYPLFLRQTAALSPADDDYLVNLTYHFKTYCEALYQCRIIGKTSAEIIHALQSLPVPPPVLPAIQEWLTACDCFKFSGVTLSSAEKQAHYNALLRLADDLSRAAG